MGEFASPQLAIYISGDRRKNKAYPVPVSTSPVAPMSRTPLGISVALSAAPARFPSLAFAVPRPSPGRGLEGIVFILPASLGIDVPLAAISNRSPP